MRQSSISKKIIIYFVIISSHCTYAQWAGSSTETGDIGRVGNVLLSDGYFKSVNSYYFDGGVSYNAFWNGTTDNRIVEGPANTMFFNGDFVFRNATNDKIGTVINWSYPFVIKNSGYVGIGTSSPNVKLHVAGTNANAHIEGELTVGAKLKVESEIKATGYVYSGNVFLSGSNNLNAAENTALSFNALWNGTNDLSLTPGYAFQTFLSSDGVVSFRTSSNKTTAANQNINWQYPMAIYPQNGGVVAIGYTDSNPEPSFVSCGAATPPLRLFVNGAIGVREVHVSATKWCDYVFDKEYDLKPLEEVESYITANKHLPEVPSEKEVAENGLAMVEMMKIQMKKIEELTLYVIELKKENKKLAQEMSRLKK